MKKGPLAIVGYMGSGKSTVGRAVAESLDWEFVDLDEAVAERAGLSIPEIFDTAGEPYFRDLEHEALLDKFGHDNMTDIRAAHDAYRQRLRDAIRSPEGAKGSS